MDFRALQFGNNAAKRIIHIPKITVDDEEGVRGVRRDEVKNEERRRKEWNGNSKIKKEKKGK